MGSWTVYHPAVFILTFSSYALFHMVRKTLSFVKASMVSEWTPTRSPTAGPDLSRPQQTWTRASLFEDGDSAEEFLGVLNATFLFIYALGLYVSGVLADRLDLRLLLGAGMLLSALVIFIFGPVLEWTGGSSKPAYLALMVVNGLLQSTGWPCVVAVMGNWFGKNSRGFVLGLWSSSSSVGSIVGALMAASAVDYGYEYVFGVTCSALFAGGVVVLFGMVSSPREVGLPMPDEDDVKSALEQRHEVDECDDITSNQQSQEPNSSSKSSLLHEQMPVPVQSNGHTEARMSNHDSKKPPWYKTMRLTSYGSTNQQTTDSGFKGKQSKLNRTIEWRGNIWQVSQQRDTTEEIHLLNTTNDKIDHNKTSHKNLALETDTDLSDQPRLPVHNDNLANVMNKHEQRVAVGQMSTSKLSSSLRPKAINFFKAIMLPGVINYSMAFAFLKMVNYVFFFWLPFYLSSAYGWPQSKADELSVWFDVGGIFGATIAGFLGGHFQKRALVMGPMLVLGIPMLYVYVTLPAGRHQVVNAAMLVVLGALIGGVSNIISTAISADLGRQDAIRGNVEALSTVAGIIEGTGTLGAALGQVAVPYLDSAFGWRSVFYLLMVAVALTVLNILPIAVTEVKEVLRNRQQRRKD